MAITLTALQPYRNGFSVNGVSADLSGCEELKAAVTGASIYLEKIMISCASAITVTIGAGETAGSVTATVIGPITFTADGSNLFVYEFKRPIKLASATALVADASGAGAVTILVEGFVE